MNVICLVTIHGVGFEQPPIVDVSGYPDTPGYADSLHEHLSKYLDPTILGDDPQRQRAHPGENGPIYVQSVWPPDSHCREGGLRRLGTWDEQHLREVDGSAAPLSDGHARIAHIALVYSQLEEQGAQAGAAAIVGAMLLSSAGRYATLEGLLHMIYSDVQPFLPHHLADNQVLSASLRPRRDPGFKTTRAVQQQPASQSLMQQLEDDVAAYVCHNEMRERVRSFVLDAILRLAYRDDVDGIVLNAHSNGTVVATDILRVLPPFAARKVLALVTAGSPLRKYTDFFTWGQHLATIPQIDRWINFYDEKDPVGDPLAPAACWRRGTTPTDLTGLLKALDPTTGVISNLHIEDRVVDNVTHSAGGSLPAHNYWDNESEFVQPLAALLKEMVSCPHGATIRCEPNASAA